MRLSNPSRRLRSVLGALLATSLGLLLWKMPFGDLWINASYDSIFRFGTPVVTNSIVLVLMDNESFDFFKQDRDRPWDRALHAQLLRRLAADGCRMIIFDAFFQELRDPAVDQELREALAQPDCVVLMAEQARVTHPTLAGARPVLPAEPFLNAARTNWGVAWLDPDLDSVVRRHWPFPNPGPYPSLPWTIARLAGAQLEETPQPRWLRYYGRDGPWTRLSYRFALSQPAGYFRNRIVFIGNHPKTSVPDGEQDEFATPYTRWTGESTGGVEIMATSFLNLVRRDWLERSPQWLEFLLLVAGGVCLGGGLCRLRPQPACAAALATALILGLGATWWSYHHNHWFPWLLIAGAQLPFATAWALFMPAFRRVRETITDAATVAHAPAAAAAAKAKSLPLAASGSPQTPDYELVEPPFGKGAYGKVWLARNAIGQWQALKVVYLANFNHHLAPYEREFNGISRYKPISDKHPGLLRVDFVSRKREDYFYYVMELGDALEPGWEQKPDSYRPRDLASETARAPDRRLPVRECVRIGTLLADALDFLHRHGLTHRDIKPQNILFVDGQPKLADIGLVADIRPADQQVTLVGTPGYMPPHPEKPGTPQADIYALGMVLYVLGTGHGTQSFPELATTLASSDNPAEFFPLNAVIMKACHPDCAQRYQTAAELRQALMQVQAALERA